MNDIIHILKNNWELIVSVLLFILSFILQLIKKKPVKVIDTVKQIILSYAPMAIRLAEQMYGLDHGDEKFKYAYQVICDAVGQIVGIQPRKVPDMYDAYIKDVIEDVLNTPQKKGGTNDAK